MKTIRCLIASLTLVTLLCTACGSPPASPSSAASPPPGSTSDQSQEAVTTATSPATSSATTETQQQAAPGQAKTNITMWLETTGGTEAAACTVANVIDPFNAQSNTIHVEATLQANWWDATRTALAGGAGPDIVGTPGPSFVLELAKAGQLLPLDDFANEFGWSKTFAPWALELGKMDGKLYSLPSEVETLVLYYNKSLFEQKGWQPPKTIDELMALAEQIASDGIILFAHGNADWRAANEWFVGEFLNHVAGPQHVYEALMGKRQWDDPEFMRAIELLNTTQQNGWFMGGLDRYYTAGFNDTRTAFGSGEAAMKIEGIWFFGDINDFFGEKAGNQNEWDWIPVPSTTGEAIFDLGIGSTYSINKHAKNSQAVAEFLSYYFSPEVQARLLTVCGVAPAPVNLQADALKDLDPRHAQVIQALNTASSTNTYGYTTWSFWPPKSDAYIYEEIEKVWAGEITPKQYLEGLQKQFDEERQAGDTLPIPAR